MDHHSHTTICRIANMFYTTHNMYLIYKITSMQQNIYKHNLDNEKLIYKHQLLITTKRAIHKSSYLFMAYQNINYITKEWPSHERVTSDTCHVQNIQKNGQPIVQYITTVTSSL
jgi:hypothetical protein